MERSLRRRILEFIFFIDKKIIVFAPARIRNLHSKECKLESNQVIRFEANFRSLSIIDSTGGKFLLRQINLDLTFHFFRSDRAY